MQFDAREIAIALQVTLFQVAANTEPVVGSLQRQIQKFAGFELDDSETTAARDSKDVEDAVIAARVGQYL